MPGYLLTDNVDAKYFCSIRLLLAVTNPLHNLYEYLVLDLPEGIQLSMQAILSFWCTECNHCHLSHAASPNHAHGIDKKLVCHNHQRKIASHTCLHLHRDTRKTSTL
jgi:hypothetical protein